MVRMVERGWCGNVRKRDRCRYVDNIKIVLHELRWGAVDSTGAG